MLRCGPAPSLPSAATTPAKISAPRGRPRGAGEPSRVAPKRHYLKPRGRGVAAQYLSAASADLDAIAQRSKCIREALSSSSTRGSSSPSKALTAQPESETTTGLLTRGSAAMKECADDAGRLPSAAAMEDVGADSVQHLPPSTLKRAGVGQSPIQPGPTRSTTQDSAQCSTRTLEPAFRMYFEDFADACQAWLRDFDAANRSGDVTGMLSRGEQRVVAPMTGSSLENGTGGRSAPAADVETAATGATSTEKMNWLRKAWRDASVEYATEYATPGGPTVVGRVPSSGAANVVAPSGAAEIEAARHRGSAAPGGAPADFCAASLNRGSAASGRRGAGSCVSADRGAAAAEMDLPAQKDWRRGGMVPEDDETLKQLFLECVRDPESGGVIAPRAMVSAVARAILHRAGLRSEGGAGGARLSA